MSVSFTDFSPDAIKWQNNFVAEFFNETDWSIGVHEFLLSGAVGSAKSVVMAWVAIYHCLAYQRNRGLLCRLALPDVKKTIFQTIVELLQDSELKEGIDFRIVETTAQIYFLKTGSVILSGSWSDNRFKKFRSLQLGFAIFEELTENNDMQAEAYHEISMRVGRLNHVGRQFVLSATNPDDPSHWVHKHFIISDDKSRHVHYSVTEDNPYLPKAYVEKLKKSLDPLMAERMLYGRWVEISKEKLYHSYELFVMTSTLELESLFHLLWASLLMIVFISLLRL
jgi:PBSX family phage terminase large subunit